MYKYKVLWFDDEHESLNIIREKAYLNDIELIGFSNAKQGIEELENNFSIYDAAIIDGLFFMSAEQSGVPSNDKALLNVAMALERISIVKKLPWFILSGQLSFTKDKNRYADGLKDNQVYDKLNETHLENLWNEIKVEANQQVETQIRLKHQRVFEVCTSKYIGENASKELLAILKSETIQNAFIESILFFNPIRKIMDDLFVAFNKFGFLPDAFVHPSVALNESSKFLSGSSEKGYKRDTPVFPKIISENVRCILSICQPASHRAEIDAFVAEINSPYLLMSTTYQLMDVLLWFKNFVDNNPDLEKNKALTILLQSSSTFTHEGIIEQDSSRNFYCDDFLLNYNYVNANFKVGDKIMIVEASENTQPRTKDLYSKFATKFIKL